MGMESYLRIFFEEELQNRGKQITGRLLNLGSGRFARKDHYENMIDVDLCSTNAVGHSISLDVNADAARLPFKANSFDTVLCTFLLEHVFEPRKVIESIKRVLRPNGTLVLSTAFLDSYHPDPKDYWRFTKDSLREILEKDFEITELTPIGGRFLWLLWFLQMQGVPNILSRPFFPAIKFLTKREKNKETWCYCFLAVARKRG